MAWVRSVAQLLIILASLAAVSGQSTSPLVAILSGSMEPWVQRGDLVLTNVPLWKEAEYNVGDIVIYKLAPKVGYPIQQIPIIHRIIETTPKSLLTRGDANF